MKGIYNEKKLYLGNKLSYTYPVYVIGKENSESFSSRPAYAHALPHCCHMDRDGWEMDRQGWTNRLAS
jgi:hypothetical protein